jgi:transcription termination factor Rho
MSGAGFDMALLEGKDRAELAAIAEQLGQKPAARAKKADIVSLIMRLVGAEETTAPAPDTAPEPEAGAPDAAADAAEEPAGDAADETGEPAAEDVAHDAEDGTAAAGAEAAEGSSGQPDQGRRGGGRNGQGNPGGGNQGARDQGGRDQGARDQGGRNQGGQPGAPNGNQNGNQGGQNANQANQQAGSHDDGPDGPNGNQRDPQSEPAEGEGESGNRRRRRRGRDRDRRPEGDEQAHVEPVEVEGMVDLRDEGYGFLRLHGYLPSRDDAYISVKQTRQFGLRTGDTVRGKSRPPARNEKNPALLQVDAVNGHEAHHQPPRPRFEDLTALFPDERLTLELPDDPSNMTVRIIDLLSPIGKGTRGLIVSPPKAGKTTIVKNVVRSIEVNHPEVELIVLLVDERPEEVTDMKRWLLRGTVASSTFDRPAEEHTAVAELVIERAKRLVETGKDVVVVLDGITRLARAYNLAAPAGGRTMSGGLETSALYPPKRFFGAARNAEEGGSLTILATALVDTNSRMDEAIFEEFKGTGNMELKLDRRLAERRVFPAIDVDASSTRHEELLFDRPQLQQIVKLRRVLGGLADETGSNAAGLEMLTDRLASFKTNAEFLTAIAKG